MLVTAVIGSYHKGNTYHAVRQIEDRMKELGDVRFRYIFLTESGLKDCKGCYACLRFGEKRCPLKDDLPEIEKQLLESDGAIFASPNFACGVTSVMKKFIERFAYIGHRPRFFGRYAVLVSTSGGPVGLKQTLDDLNYFAGGGFQVVDKLGLMTPPYALREKAAKQNERKIKACADALYRAMKEKPLKRASFADMMQFAAFRGLYIKNPDVGEMAFPADMAYWREMGWFGKKARYYCRARIGPVKRIFGLLFEKIIQAASKGLLPEKTVQ